MAGIYVQLESDGGDAVSSFDIADLVRQSGLNTVVPDNKTCASGCSMILSFVEATQAVQRGRNVGVIRTKRFLAGATAQAPLCGKWQSRARKAHAGARPSAANASRSRQTTVSSRQSPGNCARR